MNEELDQLRHDQAQAMLDGKPSVAIRTAVADLRQCMADPTYRVDFHCWHYPGPEKCSVCFAGSVLAKSFQFSPREEFVDIPAGAALRNLAWALDDLRSGCVCGGLIRFTQFRNSPRAEATFPGFTTAFSSPTPEFFAEMDRLASELEKEGL